MLTILAAAVGYLFGGLHGVAWAIVILYGLFFLMLMVG
jgi:hypothetical protein